MGKYNDFFYYFSLLGYLGFVMAFNILIFLFIYRFIAKRFGESVLLLAALLICGVFFAFYNAYRILIKKK